MSEAGSSQQPGLGRSGLAWWPLAAITLVLDQFTKHLVQAHLRLNESVTLLPVVDLVHARNYGAAFSFLDIPGGMQRWVFTGFAVVVSIVLPVFLRRLASSQRLQCAALTLIISGALGNAIDRMRFGNVVDFFAVHWGEHWFPAFNVADSCITVGAGLLLLEALLEWRREQRVASGKVQ